MGADAGRSVIIFAGTIGRAENFILIAAPRCRISPGDDNTASTATGICDGTAGHEWIKCLQDHIDQLVTCLHVGRARRGCFGVEHRADPEREPDKIARGVAIGNFCVEESDQAIKHAGFDHGDAQVGRAAGLWIGAGKIHMDIALGYRDADMQLHWPVPVDAIIVEQAFGAVFPIGQCGEGCAEPTVRCGDNLVHGAGEDSRAECAA